jgi:hypothetical protein
MYITIVPPKGTAKVAPLPAPDGSATIPTMPFRLPLKVPSTPPAASLAWLAFVYIPAGQPIWLLHSSIDISLDIPDKIFEFASRAARQTASVITVLLLVTAVATVDPLKNTWLLVPTTARTIPLLAPTIAVVIPLLAPNSVLFSGLTLLCICPR